MGEEGENKGGNGKRGREGKGPQGLVDPMLQMLKNILYVCVAAAGSWRR